MSVYEMQQIISAAAGANKLSKGELVPDYFDSVGVLKCRLNDEPLEIQVPFTTKTIRPDPVNKPDYTEVTRIFDVPEGQRILTQAIAERKAPKKPEPTADLESLKAEAEALGIAVDGRWGEKKLKTEIANAQAAA